MKAIKFIITSLALCLVISMDAKKNEPTAELKVSYLYHHLDLRNDGSVLTHDYESILLANSDCSKYYNRNNEYLDSLDSTPQGRKLSDQLMTIGIDQYLKTGDDSAIPRRKGYIYVFKSHRDKETTVYDAYGLMERGRYSEPFSEIAWQINDSTKNILGYECVMAQTDYHGRHWTAWFSPEIPLQDGPWKLCGLPGLILEAADDTSQHNFTATGIENSNQKMYPIYQPKQYDKMKRIDMLKAYAAYRRGADAYSRAMIMETPDGSKIDLATPKPRKENTQNIDFLETDYH